MNSPPAGPKPLDLRDYLQILRRRKWVIIGSIVATTTAAVVLSLLQTPRYAATAKILIQRPTSSSLFDPSTGQRLNADLTAEIETEFFKSEDVRRAAVERLGYPASATASVSGRGAVMQVRAVSTDPERASEVANAYTEAYIQTRRDTTVRDYVATAEAVQAKIDEIDRKLAELDLAALGAPPAAASGNNAQEQALLTQRAALEKSLDQVQVGAELASSGGPQVLQSAGVPQGPFSPNVQRNLMIAVFAGLCLGAAGAFVREHFDDSVRSASDVELCTGGAPMLAVVPRLADWRDRSEARLVTLEAPSSPAAEAYRTLRTSIQFAGLERPIRTIQVTSPRAQDGKTTTAANLAVAVARSGQRVILLDWDLRRPRVHAFFDLTNTVGFTSVLVGDCSLVDAVQTVPGLGRLKVLTAGPTPPDPSELLGGRRAAEVLSVVRDACDIVVVDSPPVLPVADALVVSDLIDATVLVVAAGSTTKKEAARAMELLRQVDAPVIGVVMNSSSPEIGYGYGYAPHEPAGHRPRRSRRPAGGTAAATEIVTQGAQGQA